MKVYIAGKMTGEEDYQAKFEAAEKEIREAGHIPMHSAGLPKGFEHEEYIHICKAMIDVCDALYMLPDWTDSKGAHLEHLYAMQQHKEITYLQKLPETVNPREVVQMYHEICTSLPKVRKITDARRRAIKAKHATPEEFRELFRAAQASSFLCGNNERGWIADLDWLIKPENWNRVLEGRYQNRGKNDYPQRTYTQADIDRVCIDLGD